MTVWADQLCEDGIKFSKAACAKVPNNKLDHANVWMAPVERHVLTKRHHWHGPSLQNAPQFRKPELEDKLFLPKEDDVWDRLFEIRGSSAPSWRSPGHERLYVAWTNEALFQHMHGKDVLLYGNLWMNCLFSGPQIIVRDKTKQVAQGTWMYPLVENGPNTFLGWPAEVILERDGERVCLPDLLLDMKVATGDLSRFCLWCLKLEDWEAFQYEWESPFHQRVRFRDDLPKGLGAHTCSVQSSNVMPLHHLCADNGFWDIPVDPTVTKVAKTFDIDLAGCVTDFDKVFATVQGIKKCGDRDAVECCRKREFFQQRGRAVEKLLSTEEGLEVLSKDDQKQVLKQQKEMSAAREHMKNYSSDLKQKSEAIYAAQAKAKPKAKAKAKPSPSVNPGLEALRMKKYPARVPEGSLTQAQIAPLMPPKCYIWRNTHSSSWCAHFREANKYVSHPWIEGHRESAIECVKDMWSLWLDRFDLGVEHCPFPELGVTLP